MSYVDIIMYWKHTFLAESAITGSITLSQCLWSKWYLILRPGMSNKWLAWKVTTWWSDSSNRSWRAWGSSPGIQFSHLTTHNFMSLLFLTQGSFMWSILLGKYAIARTSIALISASILQWFTCTFHASAQMWTAKLMLPILRRTSMFLKTLLNQGYLIH